MEYLNKPLFGVIYTWRCRHSCRRGGISAARCLFKGVLRPFFVSWSITRRCEGGPIFEEIVDDRFLMKSRPARLHAKLPHTSPSPGEPIVPLKLTAGVSKKLGLPGYSSVGAICHVELELDSGLIQEAPKAFRAEVARFTPSAPSRSTKSWPVTRPLATRRGRPQKCPPRDSPQPTVLALPTATAMPTASAASRAAPTAGFAPGRRPARWNLRGVSPAGSASMESNSTGFVSDCSKSPSKSFPAARRAG